MHRDSDCLEEEQVGTASFLVTHRQVEGGNRLLEVRDPLSHWRGETPRPWEFPGDKGIRVPWSHPDSKSPLCFPTAIPQEFCLATPENWMEGNEELEQKSKNMEVIYCQGTFNFTESSKLHLFFLCVPFLKDSLFLISSFQGNEWSCTQFSSLRSREGVPAWIPSS